MMFARLLTTHQVAVSVDPFRHGCLAMGHAMDIEHMGMIDAVKGSEERGCALPYGLHIFVVQDGR